MVSKLGADWLRVSVTGFSFVQVNVRGLVIGSVKSYNDYELVQDELLAATD